MIRFAFVYLVFDAFLIAISLYMGELWLLNTQVAFICSMLILFASFYGYKKAIMTKVPMVELDAEDEEFEDKEIIKKTKKEAGVLKTTFSPMRLFAYALLVLSFLYLNRHGYLQIMPFLLGLGILPLGSLALGLSFKRS